MAVGLINASWDVNDKTQWRFTPYRFTETWKLNNRFAHGFGGEEPPITRVLRPNTSANMEWQRGLHLADRNVTREQTIVHTSRFTVDAKDYRTVQTYEFSWALPSWFHGAISWFLDWEVEHNLTKSSDASYSIEVDYSKALALGAKFFAGQFAASTVLRDRFVVELFGNLLQTHGTIVVTVSLSGNYATGIASTIDTHHWLNLSCTYTRPRIGIRGLLYTHASDAGQSDDETPVSECHRDSPQLSSGWESDFD